MLMLATLGMLKLIFDFVTSLDVKLIPISVKNPSKTSNLITIFQIGWKMSEQFLARTSAASLIQLMASLMCLQLMITNKS